jgi:tetratricopeptide (TPR) repeat protein
MKIVLLVGAISFLAACNPAVSLRPLYQDEDVNNPSRDSRILGEWISPDPDEAVPVAQKWKITENSSGGYDVEIVLNADKEAAEQETAQYDARLVPIAGKMFIDAAFEKEEGGTASVKSGQLPLGVLSAHLIGQLLIEPDFLVVALPGSAWVRDNTPESFREFKDIDKYTEVSVITTTTQDLRRFMVQQAENGECFTYVIFLCRPDTDCIGRGYEYLLKKEPGNEDAEHALIPHYLEMGNYARAVELLRERMEAAPQDVSRRKALGNALLLNREFAQARIEFTRAQQVQPDDIEAEQGVAWSYFLEGDFGKAAEAFRKGLTSSAPGAADPALLAYIALRRSGKTAEAEALLSKEVASFVGAPDDQMLLLFFARRITTSSLLIAEEAQDRSRVEFFLGEQSLARGNSASAPWDLWRCIERAKKDSLYGAAATIELERLSDLNAEDK